MKNAIAILVLCSALPAQVTPPQHEHDHSKPAAKPAAPVAGAITLQELEQMALAANPVLAQAGAREQAAAGRAIQAGLWPNPVFGANGEHVSPATSGGAIGGYAEQRIVTGRKLALSRSVAPLPDFAARLRFTLLPDELSGGGE